MAVMNAVNLKVFSKAKGGQIILALVAYTKKKVVFSKISKRIGFYKSKNQLNGLLDETQLK